jgi:polyisoprenyl-teichoic acid--peptidoglycan teichoic acid transferase
MAIRTGRARHYQRQRGDDGGRRSAAGLQPRPRHHVRQQRRQRQGITLPKPGAPQTILLIGSDHRSGVTSFKKSNTDTMLLVRLNAASSTINVMSIPRDLQVEIHGFGSDKINAAYSEGGYGLLIKTIKQNVFPDLHVNHIVDTNFAGFSDLVDAIGCVYADADRRYYNVSAPGLNDDSSIDIEPGYQKLCGHNQSVSGALPFVRFRHTDTDIVREARQQDFIRWAKEQYPISKLVANRDRLLRIFGKHSTLDKTLQTEDGILELLTSCSTPTAARSSRSRSQPTCSRAQRSRAS